MAASNVKAVEDPTFDEIEAWLTGRGLLNRNEGLGEEQVERQYNMLSKCMLGNAVGEDSRHAFFCCLLPCEARLVAK